MSPFIKRYNHQKKVIEAWYRILTEMSHLADESVSVSLWLYNQGIILLTSQPRKEWLYCDEEDRALQFHRHWFQQRRIGGRPRWDIAGRYK